MRPQNYGQPHPSLPTTETLPGFSSPTALFSTWTGIVDSAARIHANSFHCQLLLYFNIISTITNLQRKDKEGNRYIT